MADQVCRVNRLVDLEYRVLDLEEPRLRLVDSEVEECSLALSRSSWPTRDRVVSGLLLLVVVDLAFVDSDCFSGTSYSTFRDPYMLADLKMLDCTQKQDYPHEV